MTASPVVYRTYDARGRLLYVGFSNNVAQRMENHRSMSWWFSIAQQVVIEPHDDIASARSAEAAAIRTEAPVGNTSHRGAGAQFDLSRYTEDDLRAADEWVGNDVGARSVRLPRRLRRAVFARRRAALASP